MAERGENSDSRLDNSYDDEFEEGEQSRGDLASVKVEDSAKVEEAPKAPQAEQPTEKKDEVAKEEHEALQTRAETDEFEKSTSEAVEKRPSEQYDDEFEKRPSAQDVSPKSRVEETNDRGEESYTFEEAPLSPTMDAPLSPKTEEPQLSPKDAPVSSTMDAPLSPKMEESSPPLSEKVVSPKQSAQDVTIDAIGSATGESATSTVADKDKSANALLYMEAAAASLDCIDKVSWMELVNDPAPGAGIAELGAAVIYLMAGIDQSLGVNDAGSVTDASWTSAQKLIRDWPSAGFSEICLGLIETIDHGGVPEINIEKARAIQEIMSDEFSSRGALGKKSRAAGLLADWVTSIIKYYDEIKTKTQKSNREITAEERTQVEELRRNVAHQKGQPQKDSLDDMIDEEMGTLRTPQRTPQQSKSEVNLRVGDHKDLKERTAFSEMTYDGVLKRTTFMHAVSTYPKSPGVIIAGRTESTMIKSNQGPAPGSYNLPPEEQNKYKATAKYSFGGCSRFGLGASPTKQAPGPGQYNPKDPTLCVDTKVGFGTSVRGKTNSAAQANPGPGAYESRSGVGGGLMFTARGRHPTSYMRSRSLPGPGAYTPTLGAAYQTPPKCGFGTSTRGDFTGGSQKGMPGPGTYEMQNFKCMGKDSKKFSATSRRRMHDLNSYVTPGPGTYNAHATSFGHAQHDRHENAPSCAFVDQQYIEREKQRQAQMKFATTY